MSGGDGISGGAVGCDAYYDIKFECHGGMHGFDRVGVGSQLNNLCLQIACISLCVRYRYPIGYLFGGN